MIIASYIKFELNKRVEGAVSGLDWEYHNISFVPIKETTEEAYMKQIKELQYKGPINPWKQGIMFFEVLVD